MDFSEKAYARLKFRSSRGRGRGGRGGSARGGHHVGHTRKSTGVDLDSNAFRYGEEGDQAEDGVVVPKSQGADLEALLDDAEVAFNQAFYRFRAQVQDITDEAPPLGGTHPEQLLAIDLDQLSASLAALPLHALLGLEPHYLEGLEPQDTPQPQQSVSAAPSRQTLHATASPKPTGVGAMLPGDVKLPAAVSPTVQLQVAAGAGAGIGLGYGGPTSQLVPPPAAPLSTTAPDGNTRPHEGSDDEDGELAALLMGRAPVRQLQPVTQPATVVTLAASAQGGSARGTVSPAGGAITRSANGGLQRAGPPAATASVSATLPGGLVVRSGPAGPVRSAGAVVGPLAPGAAAGRLVTPAPPAAGLTASTMNSVSAASVPCVRLSGPAMGASSLSGRSAGIPAGSVVLAAASAAPEGKPRPHAGAGGGGESSSAGGVMDEELAQLLGLPVAAAAAKIMVSQLPAARVPAAVQVPHKLGVRPSTATLAPVSGRAAPTSQQQPAPAKSLDDWLKDLC